MRAGKFRRLQQRAAAVPRTTSRHSAWPRSADCLRSWPTPNHPVRLLPESVLASFDSEPVRSLRNDYQHLDERLDAGHVWSVIGGPLKWTKTTQGEAEVIVDALPLLIAAEQLYMRLLLPGQPPIQLRYPSTWEPDTTDDVLKVTIQS